MTATALIAHAVIAVTILVCYAVLTALGHDAQTLLGVLAGQGVGVGITSAQPKGA